MRSGRIHRRRGATVLAACWLAAAAAAGSAPRWRVVSGAAADDALPLPPLARVATADVSGKTWRQAGELGGSVVAARADFWTALSAAGWTLDKTIVLGRAHAVSELMVWTRRRRRVLLMVWEKEAGTCGFAWGEER